MCCLKLDRLSVLKGLKGFPLLRFVLRLNPSYKPYAAEKANSEEGEKRGNQRLKETSQDGAQTRKVKGGSAKTFKESARSQTQPK